MDFFVRLVLAIVLFSAVSFSQIVDDVNGGGNDSRLFERKPKNLVDVRHCVSFHLISFNFFFVVT